MGQKQIVTKTKVKAILGLDVTYFWNSRAGCFTKLIGDGAGL